MYQSHSKINCTCSIYSTYRQIFLSQLFQMNLLQFCTFFITFTHVCSICKWHWRMQALHYEMSHCQRRWSSVLLMAILSKIGSLKNFVTACIHVLKKSQLQVHCIQAFQKPELPVSRGALNNMFNQNIFKNLKKNTHLCRNF